MMAEAESETTPNPISRLPVDFIDCIDYHDAVDQLKLLNRGAGFVITIDRTKADSNALKQTRKVFLRCWKSRAYKSTSTGRRRGHTRSTECPWRATLTRQDGGWRVEVKHMEHNHELDEGSPPRPTVLRRQVPKAPLRALAALTPHQLQGEGLQPTADPLQHPNGFQPLPPMGVANGEGAVYAPQPFGGYSPYPSFPAHHLPPMAYPPAPGPPAPGPPAPGPPAPGPPGGPPSQNPQGHDPSGSNITWLTPLGPQSAARMHQPRPPPPPSTGPQPPSGAPASSGPAPPSGRRVRRGGYAVMSEIPVSPS
ncbi:uncharacterized protein EI97DRAFT_249749 [Westerdykella ornata]|uniref:FAR1 domain-containing protein n=1 Tax=Westerdykella ornata TaxID=318751 RepID=A0A6A6JPU8_WESOR|nr:uncharacterized protein EI97DRAFT_249749 [Westerdykella ornata]KAF2278285.1 hypothetical protein EI97DRAFT_249749 [Westerdykella ornata]